MGTILFFAGFGWIRQCLLSTSQYVYRFYGTVSLFIIIKVRAVFLDSRNYFDPIPVPVPGFFPILRTRNLILYPYSVPTLYF